MSKRSGKKTAKRKSPRPQTTPQQTPPLPPIPPPQTTPLPPIPPPQTPPPPPIPPPLVLSGGGGGGDPPQPYKTGRSRKWFNLLYLALKALFPELLIPLIPLLLCMFIRIHEYSVYTSYNFWELIDFPKLAFTMTLYFLMYRERLMKKSMAEKEEEKKKQFESSANKFLFILPFSLYLFIQTVAINAQEKINVWKGLSDIKNAVANLSQNAQANIKLVDFLSGISNTIDNPELFVKSVNIKILFVGLVPGIVYATWCNIKKEREVKQP